MLIKVLILISSLKIITPQRFYYTYPEDNYNYSPNNNRYFHNDINNNELILPSYQYELPNYSNNRNINFLGLKNNQDLTYSPFTFANERDLNSAYLIGQSGPISRFFEFIRGIFNRGENKTTPEEKPVTPVPTTPQRTNITSVVVKNSCQCSDVVEYICGVNNIVYVNRCFMDCANIDLQYYGPC